MDTPKKHDNHTKTAHAEPVAPPPVPIAAPITPTIQPTYPGQSAQPPVGQPSGLSIGSMITGILAIIMSFVPILGLLLGITAIILGILALKQPAGRGFTIAGIVTGGVGALINIFAITLLAISFSLFTGAVQESIKEAEQNRDNQSQSVVNSDKRELAKGESATIKGVLYTVELSERNFIPASRYQAVKEGEELITVKIIAENVGEGNASLYTGAFSAIDEMTSVETSKRYSYISGVSEELRSQILEQGESVTGYLTFVITKDAKEPKIVIKQRYTSYDEATKTENLVYIFAL